MNNYEHCMVKGIRYECSDTITKQGTRDSVTKYLKNGYYIKEARNGYWVLIKPSRVIVTVKNSTGTQSVNMKQDILDYYGKQKISDKQIKLFVHDVENEKIAIHSDINGRYFITATSK